MDTQQCNVFLEIVYKDKYDLKPILERLHALIQDFESHNCEVKMTAGILVNNEPIPGAFTYNNKESQK